MARSLPKGGVFWLFVAAVSWSPAAGQLQVIGMSPPRNGVTVHVDATIRIDFDRPLNPATITAQTIGAFGRWSGPVTGNYLLENGNQTVVFQPDSPFSHGELVSVFLSEGVQGADGMPLGTGGYSHQFWTRSQRVTNLNYQQIDSMTTDSPSRPYGGVATDLDNDGWLDLTIVNEDSADLRVFMNRADGSGTFYPYIEPTFPVGNRASPSESADFNRDGNADIAVVNIDDNTVSVLLGNGDGSYGPQQTIGVGTTPRGIAVLDADGDGDADIVNTNRGSNNLSLHINDGNGLFGLPANFEGGVSGEWSLMSGDMDNDGLLDLVVAGGNAAQVRVLTGNGDGTFTQQPLQDTGGRSWMIMLGDLNGDGNLDVTSANALNDTGSVLLGNGDGTLQPATVYDIASMGGGGNSFPLATDLGDLDGDGDLDWMTSSFGGEFVVLLNDGSGSFDFFTELEAPRAASCTITHDFDNDGDLDLALVDELANVVILQRNEGTHVAEGDFNADGALDGLDADALVGQIAAMLHTPLFDLNGDSLVDQDDLLEWLAVAGEANLPSGNPYLVGDADLNGVVDGLDFLAWNSNKFSAIAAWTAGDFTADGFVDGLDFLAWNENKFLSSALAVPEPHVLFLLAVSLIPAGLAVSGRRENEQQHR